MITILIPVFNRWNYTEKCLQSLMQQTFTDFQVVVIDHGSKDGTSDFIRKDFPLVKIVKGTSDLWWTGAINLALKELNIAQYPDDDFVLTLNNDLIVQPNYLNVLVEASKLKPQALIGSLTVDIDRPDNLHFVGTQWSSVFAKYRPAVQAGGNLLAFQSKHKFVETDLLTGRGVLIPAKVFRLIGLYDEKNFPHYMADEDFSLSAKKAGYSLFIAPEAVVFSKVNETGINTLYKRKNASYYFNYFTSIKSPGNIRYRWRWSKKHAAVPALYFPIDLMRLFFGQLKK